MFVRAPTPLAKPGFSEHQRKTALRIANIPQHEFEGLVESFDPPTITDLAERGTQKVRRLRTADRSTSPRQRGEVGHSGFQKWLAKTHDGSVTSLLREATPRVYRMQKTEADQPHGGIPPRLLRRCGRSGGRSFDRALASPWRSTSGRCRPEVCRCDIFKFDAAANFEIRSSRATNSNAVTDTRMCRLRHAYLSVTQAICVADKQTAQGSTLRLSVTEKGYEAKSDQSRMDGNLQSYAQMGATWS